MTRSVVMLQLPNGIIDEEEDIIFVTKNIIVLHKHH